MQVAQQSCMAVEFNSASGGDLVELRTAQSQLPELAEAA
jgi:hypothetical protein